MMADHWWRTQRNVEGEGMLIKIKGRVVYSILAAEI